MSKKEKRRYIAIIFLVVFLSLLFIGNYIMRKNMKENTGIEIGTSATPGAATGKQNAVPDDTVTTSVQTMTAEQQITTLKNDCVRFINAYTATTSGTYASAKLYYDTLAPMMTDSAAEEYLDLDTLKSPDSFAEGENPSAKIENAGIKVYILSDDIAIQNTAEVYIACNQTLKADEIKTTYLYHFVGKFKYFPTEKRWKCSSIEKATVYTE